ncbi:MAG TPA: hypothetical protein VGR11_03155, partial [Solirubrobacteraceae bacterium]|nr:hypothetical protein [Solirubrobacteraceae bacterium]
MQYRALSTEILPRTIATNNVIQRSHEPELANLPAGRRAALDQRHLLWRDCLRLIDRAQLRREMTWFFGAVLAVAGRRRKR